MKKTGIFSLLLLLVTTAWAQPSPTVPAALKETKVSNAELLKWTFNGIGKVYDESGRQICLQEGENSLGVGLYSPLSYKGDVVMRYKVMPLNAATVLVNLLCMSDEGESLELTFPDGYDGSMGPILNKEDYFIAFRHRTVHQQKSESGATGHRRQGRDDPRSLLRRGSGPRRQTRMAQSGRQDRGTVYRSEYSPGRSSRHPAARAGRSSGRLRHSRLVDPQCAISRRCGTFPTRLPAHDAPGVSIYRKPPLSSLNTVSI